MIGEVSYILIEFIIPIKLVMLIKMSLNEAYSKIHLGKRLCDVFHIQNGLKKKIFYHHCFSTLL
jgi:hypothetical protein